MFRNYLKIAVRNLFKNKIYSFINIFGLTTGLACFLLIVLYIFDELTYDRFHKNSASVYRVVEQKISAEGKESKVASVAFNISEAAKKDFPEVENATRFSMLGRVNLSNAENTNVFYESYYLADASFFKVFSFPFLEGDANTALNDPHSVVMTDETAKKIFGHQNVLGQFVRADRDSMPYKITGVVTISRNSHISFNVLFSEATLNTQAFGVTMASLTNDWSSNNFVTYLQLKNTNDNLTADKLTRLVPTKRTDQQSGKSNFFLQPLKDIHFYSEGIEGDMGRKGNITHMYVFGIVALFVLLIACINYMNLTTARFAGRSKEIAVRKVAGAGQQNLVSQFMAEAFLVTILSLIFALTAVKFLLPAFNSFTEKNLHLGLQTDYRIWIGILLLIVLVSFISGIYPAFFQSRLKPYLLLKNKIETAKGNLPVRKALVVFQFTLSIIMIVATMVVYQQLKYVDTKDMGFDKEQLMVVDINSGLVRRSAQTIKTEFGQIPGVKNVSTTSRVPGEWKVIPKVKVKNETITAKDGESAYYLVADEQFLQTFKVKLLGGRNLSSQNPADSASVMINQAAAIMLKIKEPSEQMIEIPSVDFSGNASVLQQPFRARVIGIVQDFNFQSLREKVAPMIISFTRNPVHSIDYFTARLDTKDYQSVLKQMENVLAKIDPEHLFEYNFLDKKWDIFYREDEKRKIIFFSVALMTILIACLGLFGLATYTAQQRTKEIGIRKVLGASIKNIVGLLSQDFLKLVLIAALIAFPVAAWVMYHWLQDFEYRVSLSVWVFLLAGFLALFIALFTISFQAIKAAIANPVKSLRTE
jgi:putative ABC transport system permease protein